MKGNPGDFEPANIAGMALMLLIVGILLWELVKGFVERWACLEC